MDVQEAQRKFADLLGRVHDQGETIILERFGEPIAAVISVELYEQLMAEREARFEVIDRIRANVPHVSEAESSVGTRRIQEHPIHHRPRPSGALEIRHPLILPAFN